MSDVSSTSENKSYKEIINKRNTVDTCKIHNEQNINKVQGEKKSKSRMTKLPECAIKKSVVTIDDIDLIKPNKNVKTKEDQIEFYDEAELYPGNCSKIKESMNDSSMVTANDGEQNKSHNKIYRTL